MLFAVRISSYGCTWEVWSQLESTQEARVALGCASSNSYASLCSPNFPRASITRYTHAKHEPILKFILDLKFEWQIYMTNKYLSKTFGISVIVTMQTFVFYTCCLVTEKAL